MAINADFFDPYCSAANEAKNLEGLAVSNGSPASADQAGQPALLLSSVNAATIINSNGAPLNLSNLLNAVSGSNILVANGQDIALTASNSSPMQTPAPWSASRRTAANFT